MYKRILAILFAIFSLAACSKSKDLRIVKHYLTTDWDTKRYVIEGEVQNNGKETRENVTISYELKMKDGKKYAVGEVVIPKLNANADIKEFKLDIQDKVKDIKDFTLTEVETFYGEIK